MSTITKDLGAVTAYAYAKEKGYTGTEAEYAELMASYASVAQQAGESAQTATGKAQQASASATSASQSADTASASATSAQASATTATVKASEAQQSATTASTKAQEALQSASTASTKAQEASQSATDAESAKTASETARASAESARDDAETARDEAQDIVDGITGKVEQIDSNTERIESLEDDRYKPYPTDTASGSIASFPDGADDIPLKSCIVRVEPVQEGSGDPSPDNIRPITGWTGVEVQRCGKNLLSNAVNSVSANGITFTVNEDRSITVNGTATARENLFYSGTLYIPPAEYYLSIGKTFAEGQCYFEIVLYKAATGTNQFVNTNARSGYPFTVEKGDYIRQIYFSVFAGKTVNDTIYPQIELGSTATDYEPYQGNTYPITFPSEAGTVYGGTLDVTNEELVVDRAQIASYNGETLPSTWISDRDVYASGTTPTIGAQVVYKLETPIHYPITSNQINSLYGQNNLWANTGDTEVEYRADTKLYIEKLTQPEEYDMIADSNITNGSYFMVGNDLYLATANIASGASVIVGTNATKVSLAEALNEINA